MPDANDLERFNAIYQAHHLDVVRYAYRRLGDDRAQDVAAETFAVAWRRMSDVPAASPLPWLYATARRVLANQVRGEARRERLRDRLAETAQTSAAGVFGREHGGDLAEVLAVRRALEQLSEADQEVLRLIGWEELSVVDAARVVGCSRSVLGVRLHRARKRLRRALAAPLPPPRLPVQPSPVQPSPIHHAARRIEGGSS